MTNSIQNNEAAFMSWLSENMPYTQITELRFIITEIEQQAKKMKLIKNSLYGNIDPTTVKRIRSNIEQSRIFKFKHKRQWGQILSILDYLLRYSNTRSTEIATATQSVYETDSVTVPGTTHSESKENNADALRPATVIIKNKNTNGLSPEIGAGTGKTIDFNNLQSIAFTKPTLLSYFGNEKQESSWKGLYVDACSFLIEDYPDIFDSMRTESILGSGKIWLVDEQRISLLRVPKRVAENFYVETNRSASDLIKNIKLLLDKCLVDYENIIITYLEKDCAKQSLQETSNMANISAELATNLGNILMQEFEDGYRIGDYMHRTRFLSAYEEKYHEEFGKTVDEMEDVLRNIGQVRDDRIFYSDKSDSNVLADIYEDINNSFDNGATSIYYECLYDDYSERLALEMNIYSADTLRTAIQGDADFPKEYRAMKSCITKYGIDADSNEEIRKVLQTYPVPVTFEEIQSRVKHIPLYKVKQALVQIPDAAYIDEGTYFYAPNFYISAEEKIALIHAMRTTISTKGFLVAKDLRDIFRNTCPSSAMDSEQYKDHSIRNILKVLLRDEFEFSSSTITEKGKPLDYGQIFQNYAADRERVTLNELLELKKELGLPVIYWDNVFNEMIRISATEMVHKGTVEFDVAAVDRVLDEMYPDEYTPLKDVTLFLNLPPASVRWNGFLLESFLREYSENFKLVQLSISQDDYFGVMLKSASTLKNYADVAADMLARNHSWSDEKSALQLLKNMKFQQRAKNSNISTIIKAAKQKRLNID